MRLLESKKIDHLVQVFDDAGTIRVKLTDESDEAHFIDPNGTIECGHFLIPLVGGKKTPCSAEQAAYILSHLPMAVQVMDEHREVHVAQPNQLPDDRKELLKLLRHDVLDIWRIENQVNSGLITKAPAWYVALRAASPTPESGASLSM
jgi:hypothetical protein